MVEPTSTSSPMQHQVESTIEGVIFSKSIRSYFFILHVVITEQERHVVVRIQVAEDERATELRSWCRRSLKLGDLLTIRGCWSKANYGTDRNHARLVVNVFSTEDANERIQVKQIHTWNMEECQLWQQQYCATNKNNQLPPDKKRKCQEEKNELESTIKCRHGGGRGKRNQAELLANFLLHMMSQERNDDDSVEPFNWTEPLLNKKNRKKAIDLLNTGSGVIDAAGGSGHVSMALGLVGVKSTVVDPRESVGKLPGRDRKAWNRALRSNLVKASCEMSGGTLFCQPFDTIRAWFASRPEGVNESFRNVDAADVPVCDENHDLMTQCSAIVALHPDEATDAIVDMAVQQKKPFVIVPCCVFARLFPNRYNPNSPGNPVTTYEDLVDYLAAKHSDIKRTELPFLGANVALWATFN